MALFKVSKDVKEMECRLKNFKIQNVPLHMNEQNLLGEGTFGKVYKYELKGKYVAAKIFKCQYQRVKILRLADSLLKLSHNNVCSFLGFSTRPAILFIEYCVVDVNGEEVNSLRGLLDMFNESMYFNLLERVNYCIQASLGLQYLHECNIIHQDFKPANLLVTGTLENLMVKCCDFGDIAHAKSTVKSMSTLNNVKGMAAGFIAPEILSHGAKASIDTDIYTLGFSIFEIVSDMENPWEKVLPIYSDTLLFEKVKNNERPYTKEVFNIYKEQLHQIRVVLKLVEKCWHASPVCRPKLQEVWIFFSLCCFLFINFGWWLLDCFVCLNCVPHDKNSINRIGVCVCVCVLSRCERGDIMFFCESQ